MAFRTGSEADAALAQLLQLSQYYQSRRDRKIEKKSSNLENLIKLTSNMDAMTSLGDRIREADVDFDNMGDDETGDVLLSLHQTKFDIMKKGQDAFNKLNEMNLGITDQESFSNTSKNILDMNWAEVNKNMRQLYLYENDLSNALKLGVTFKGSDNVSPELLQTTVQQYKVFYNNKFNLLAKRNVFDIPDEDIQAFDEEFGVALMTYGPEQFSRFMGGHQKLIQNKLSDAEQKRNMYYNHYVRAGQEGGFAEASEDLGVFGEVSPGTMMATGFYEEKYKEYQNTAQLLNERHKEFYGSYFNDNPSLIKGHVSSDENILDSAVNKFLGTQDKEKKDEEKKDEEKKDEPTINLPPAATISWDKDINTVSIGKPKEKETLIQEGLFKASSSSDIKESLDDVEFRHNKDGKIINITRYDKKTNSYFDADGNKYLEDEISINADSLVSFKPKLKKANGEYYFFDPTKNQFTKWGTSSSFGNQTMEIFNGKKVPTVILNTEYGEGLVVGGKTIKGESSEKLIYHNGKWRHLKKINGKWKFINK